jgi:type II secretory pathway pseudopilin PulG
MFCFKCGASMPDDATICPQCATPVQSIPTAPPPPQAPQAGAPTPASTSAWLNVPPAQTQYPPQQAYPPQAQPYPGQFQPQTDGKATASLILGILSILCFGLLTGLPAIILGHISRGNIEQSRGRLTGAGMALAGLIMGYVSIISTILIIAAIAIPNLLRSRMAANESTAMSTVRSISVSQVTYSTTYPTQGYAPDLATLGPGSTDSCSGGGTVEHACLLDGVLANARCTSGIWCQKGAYKFTISSDCRAPNPSAQQDQQGQGACAEFVVAATPVSSNMGFHNYCVVSDAVVRSRTGGPIFTPPTVEECQGWAPI